MAAGRSISWVTVHASAAVQPGAARGGPASETTWRRESTADHALRVRLWHGAGAHRRAAAQMARLQLAARRYRGGGEDVDLDLTVHSRDRILIGPMGPLTY
jgi:hypothetical protein